MKLPISCYVNTNQILYQLYHINIDELLYPSFLLYNVCVQTQFVVIK